MVTISCIIPVYNVERYLRACLDSVLAQTFTDYEIILVNDGSTDSSEEICSEYVRLDSRVRLISKQNGGVSSARNLGIDVATGQFVCFVDADDIIVTSCFERLITLSRQHDCVAVAGKIGAKMPLGEKNLAKGQIEMVENWHEFGCASAMGSLTSACATLYSREIIVTNNIRFDESLRFGEDRLFNVEYFVATRRVLIVNQVIYLYLIHDNSSFHKFHLDGALENWILCMKRFLSIISRDDVPECDKRDLIVNLYLSIHTSLIINACSAANKKDVKKEIARVEEEYTPLFQVSGKEKLAYLSKSNWREGILYFLTMIRAFWLIRMVKQVKRGLRSRS